MAEIRRHLWEIFRKLASTKNPARETGTGLNLKKQYFMNSVTFAKELVGVQDELLRFAYKL